MHISITGSLGSGKSTVSRYLCDHYAFTRYSTGDVQRELAEQLGMTTLQFNLYCQQMNDASYDRMIDDKVVAIASERMGDDLIFDSRMAWNFVPSSFKVFLWVDPAVAAKRVFEDTKRGEVESYASVEEAAEKLKERTNSESERFHAFYGVRYTDLIHYDLILDTSAATPEEIAEIIMTSARLYSSGEFTILREVIRHPEEFR